MNAIMNKTNNGKLIAAIVVMTMMVCAIAMVMPSSDAAGIENTIQQAPGDAVEIDDISEITGAGNYVIKAPTDDTTNRITVTSNFTIPAGAKLYIGENYIDYIGTEDGKIYFIINEGVTLTIAGTVYNNSGDNSKTSAIVNNGTISFTGEGALYSTSAVNKISTGSMMNTFFTSTGETYQNYKHVYSADVNTVIPYVMNKHYSDMEGEETAKAIYTYGNVSIASITDGNNISEINLKVGGISGAASTLTVAQTADLTFSSVTIKEESQANVYGILKGTAVTNDGTVRIMSEKATFGTVDTDGEIGGTGSVDTSAVSENATLSGRLLTSTTFTDRQIVTVTDNLTLVSGTVLTIQGQLVIPEGVTVTIEDGAQLKISGQSVTVDNKGTILIQSAGPNADGAGLVVNGGTFTNDGTVDAQYLPTNTGADADDKDIIIINAAFKNNGTVNIGTDSKISVNGGTFTNTVGANFTVTGTIETSAGTVENAGTFTISGVASGTVSIYLTAENAVANITAVNGNIVINDTNFKSADEKKPFGNTNNDSITINGKDGNSVGGIIIKAVTYTEDKKTYKALDISGTLVVSTNDGTTASVEDSLLRLTGDNIRISETFTVGAGTELNLGPYNSASGSTVITVLGTMNVTAQAGVKSGNAYPVNTTFGIVKSGASVDFVVSGSIVSLVSLHTIEGVQMNAAMYTTVANAITTYNYTTLGAAITAVSGTTNAAVNVYGEIDVDEEVVIPSGMTVTMDSKTSSQINITKDGRIEVSENGRLATNGNTIDVEGSLYIANYRTGISGVNSAEGSESIKSQVYSSNGTDALYTNLIDAMADAESGDTITLYSKPVKLENTSFTIKDGVTVDTDGKAFGVYGTNLTINGTLFINGSEYTVSTYKVSESYDAPSTVILNGYIKNTEQMTYAENDLRYPAGAYYTMTENGVPYYYVTTVANAASVINDTEGNTVLLDGKLAVGSVTFNGTEDDQAIINIAATAEITSGTITLNLAELNIASGAEFTATVTDGVGSVDVKIVDSEDGTASAAPTFTVTAEDGLTVTGTAAGAEMTVTGDVIANGLTVTTLAVDGTLTVEEGNTIVNGKLTITGTVNVVTGALTVSNATLSTGNTAMTYVTGTLSTSVASAESTDNGTATLGPLYVGIGIENDRLVDGQAGTVSGNVTATIAYVSSDSTVPEKMISGDGMKSTQFYVDDTLWMTAYTADATSNKANVPNAPVTDAMFMGWNDADGKLVYSDNEPEGTSVPDTNAIEVGAYDGKLYASIKYNVYNVIIIADNSIGSIAVDGVILAKDMNGYYTTTEPMIAGQHTVTYTLAAGYEGTVTLSSTNTAVSGMTFNLTGDFEETTYILTIGGATYAGSTVVVEGGNGGTDNLGLTDYLLIVLVVLIVIMAIMVAMRLMRS